MRSMCMEQCQRLTAGLWGFHRRVLRCLGHGIPQSVARRGGKL